MTQTDLTTGSTIDFQQVAKSLKTPRDFIRWGASAMATADLWFGHGTDNALDESVRLVLQILHLPDDVPDALLEGRLLKSERAQLAETFQQRIEARIPLPYLTHQSQFMGLPFYVDERVLIPRSPIGEMIEASFEPWLHTSPTRILDIGTGSGCIAIACALAFPDAAVDAVDLSSDALSVAQINIEKHELKNQVTAIQSDLFSSISGQTYSLIVSNPPYVDAAELAAMPAEYHAEPRMALAAGEDGLDLVIKLLRDAPDYLEPDGILVVEVGYSWPALEQTFPELAWFWVDFEHGGEGVFVIDRETLVENHELFV